MTDLVILRTYHMTKYPSYIWRYDKFIHITSQFFYNTINIVQYGYPLLLILGTISNIMAFAFSVLTYKHSDLCIYFIFLSLADTFTLWINVFPSILHLYVGRYHSDWITSTAQCRTYMFLQHFSRAVAGWLVVVTTMTRLLALRNPFTWRTKSATFHVKMCFFSILIAATLCTPSLFLYDRLEFGVGQFIALCHMMPKGFVDYEVHLYWASFVFPIVPVLLVAIFNVAILCMLFSVQRFRDKNSSSSSKSHTCSSNSQVSSSSNQQIITLLAVSTLFLALSAPHVWNSLRQLYSEYDFGDIRESLERGTGPFYNLESYTASFILYINNCINFYVYILSGKTLRTEFLKRLWRAA